jgi:hypothetical protein
MEDENVDIAYLLMKDIPVEICGKIFHKKLYVENVGKNVIRSGQEVGMCISPGLSPEMWHTHPWSKHPYPSPEDIFNILHYQKRVKRMTRHDPITQYIYTRWGIWRIHSRKKYEFDKNWEMYLLQTFHEQGNKLYFDTDSCRKYDLKHIKNYITKVLKKVNGNKYTKFSLEIEFVPWKIEKNSV